MEGDPGYVLEEIDPNVTAASLWRQYSTTTPQKVGTTGGIIEDIGNIVTAPFKAVSGAASSLYDKATSGLRNTFLYLIGGTLLIGILALMLVGAGTKFLNKAEGQ